MLRQREINRAILFLTRSPDVDVSVKRPDANGAAALVQKKHVAIARVLSRVKEG